MDRRGVLVYDVSIVFLALIWVMVPLRLYVRIGMKRAFGYDDFFLILSLIFCSTHLILPLCEPVCNVRADVTTFSPGGMEDNLRCFFVGQLFYVLASGTIKISFCFSLYRLLVTRWKQLFVCGIMIVVSIIGLFYFFWLLFQCNPVAYFWQRVTNPGGGSCLVPTTMVGAVYAHAVVMLLSDTFLAVLPIFIVKDLQMGWKSKLSVVGILAIGSLPSVATIVRITLIRSLEKQPRAFDFLGLVVDFVIWSVVEAGASIIAVSATALRPLATKISLVSSLEFSRERQTGFTTGTHKDIPLNTFDIPRSISHEAILADEERQGSSNSVYTAHEGHEA
ncbi:hypothetical protein AOCH_002278 [Aspergillus ochraceoroseus]|nr:hypothetical protein AOCH_002278 [Aspergillus ochraceoroseus]